MLSHLKTLLTLPKACTIFYSSNPCHEHIPMFCEHICSVMKVNCRNSVKYMEQCANKCRTAHIFLAFYCNNTPPILRPSMMLVSFFRKQKYGLGFVLKARAKVWQGKCLIVTQSYRYAGIFHKDSYSCSKLSDTAFLCFSLPLPAHIDTCFL